MLYASTNDPVVKAPGSVYIIGGQVKAALIKYMKKWGQAYPDAGDGAFLW